LFSLIDLTDKRNISPIEAYTIKLYTLVIIGAALYSRAVFTQATIHWLFSWCQWWRFVKEGRFSLRSHCQAIWSLLVQF